MLRTAAAIVLTGYIIIIGIGLVHLNVLTAQMYQSSPLCLGLRVAGPGRWVAQPQARSRLAERGR